MATYGYIENGYLRAKDIEPLTERYLDDNGDVHTRTISVADQVAMLSDEWKPVDDVDESLTDCTDAKYTIRLVPYDAGTHIAFRYQRVVNTFKLREDAQILKDQLSATDYQIIKCYEASLVGEELPYDVVALHTSRNAIRAQINDIEIAQAQLLDD